MRWRLEVTASENRSWSAKNGMFSDTTLSATPDSFLFSSGPAGRADAASRRGATDQGRAVRAAREGSGLCWGYPHGVAGRARREGALLGGLHKQQHSLLVALRLGRVPLFQHLPMRGAAERSAAARRLSAARALSVPCLVRERKRVALNLELPQRDDHNPVPGLSLDVASQLREQKGRRASGGGAAARRRRSQLGPKHGARRQTGAAPS